MRPEEHQYVRSERLGFFNAGGDEAGPTDRDLIVCAGYDIDIPFIEATLCRLVIARHAQGEYTTRQTLGWLATQNEYDDFMGRLYDATPFEPDDPLSPEVEAVCRAWLLERHQQNDVVDEWDEYSSDLAVHWAARYLPDWLDYTTGSGAGMGGSEVGRFTLPEGRTLTDVTDQMERAIHQALTDLKPTLPPAEQPRRS